MNRGRGVGGWGDRGSRKKTQPPFSTDESVSRHTGAETSRLHLPPRDAALNTWLSKDRTTVNTSSTGRLLSVSLDATALHQDQKPQHPQTLGSTAPQGPGITEHKQAFPKTFLHAPSPCPPTQLKRILTVCDLK